MTARERIESAFDPCGTSCFGAVIPYEGILIRDHWHELTRKPWWYRESPDLKHQIEWRRDFLANVPTDWIAVRDFYTKDRRCNLQVTCNGDNLTILDKQTGETTTLRPPRVSGWNPDGGIESVRPSELPTTTEDIDRLVPTPPVFDREVYRKSGACDLADLIMTEFSDLCPIASISSPPWRCYELWGFEAFMTKIVEQPDIIQYACGRLLDLSLYAARKANALGASVIWIEECMTDMISPDAYKSLCVPFLASLIDEIHTLGMKSILYFCGNPKDKLDFLVGTGADGLAFEESKKGFSIDIMNLAEYVRGKCALLGNVDAINFLPSAQEEQLKCEILRQFQAGRLNCNRFILSLGSPVTPETSIARVRLFLEMAHDLSARSMR